jgi:NAD(P) transhydrogenase subunit alpha
LGANPEAGRADLPSLRPSHTVIAMLDPLARPVEARELAGRGLTSFALELVPRITRAQSMDVLSSMATIAGYQAVILGARYLNKIFPMMMTAAGSIKPARVFVLGAGVAGLQAIATARRLGAVVEAFDIRPEVKEQVESVGARFVELALETEAAGDESGYARAQSEDFLRRQQELMAEGIAAADVLITTAAVPGRRAPVLVTGEMVAAMRPGSVVVDLASDTGGNCAVTRPGETYDHEGICVVGVTNLPARAPLDASMMFAKNITTFLAHLLEDGMLVVDLEDEITRGTLLTRDGAVVHERVLATLQEASP